MIINMMQMEDAINRARQLDPPVDYVLSHDLSLMAEAYALMIYAGVAELDLAAIPEQQRIAIVQYLSVPPGEAEPGGIAAATVGR